MNSFKYDADNLPEEQRVVRSKCVHPTGTFIPFPADALDQSIPELFEKHARINPNHLAIKTLYHAYTYDELDRAANRVAHAIIGLRGEGEENIAVLIEHGAIHVIVILGILKAGKVYVPLDPLYPPKRLAYMLDDSQAELLVTNKSNRSLANDLAQRIPIIDIDDLKSPSCVENLPVQQSSTCLATILYTSGSTGKPKGFAQTHRNIILDIRNYTNAAHFCKDDRMLLVASFSFAGSIRPLYSALLNGATLYPIDIRTEGITSLAEWLIGNEITIYRSVPTVFRHFVNTLDSKEKFPHIRLIILGGEPVYKKDVELYRDHFSEKCILLNRLGSGEVLTYCMNFIDKKTKIKGTHIPVGYVVSDKAVVLLDDEHNGNDKGQLKEIAVKSEFIFSGYWKRPDLDRDVLFQDDGSENSRIYCTGDVGLMHPDGCLVHYGRKDYQVKIRGNRIEIAEIEMALLDFFMVREAAVRLWEDESGDHRLVAYVVPETNNNPSVSELRNVLSETLPAHMVPSTFMILEALPLNTSGKVSRLALPKPSRLRPNLDNSYVAPSKPIEKRVAEIWSQALHLDKVGVTDNFFELGGHSLLATQIISKVIKTFKVNVSLQVLFQASTVADMTKIIVPKMVEKVENKDLNQLLADLSELTEEEALQRFTGEVEPRGNKDDGSQ